MMPKKVTLKTLEARVKDLEDHCRYQLPITILRMKQKRLDDRMNETQEALVAAMKAIIRDKAEADSLLSKEMTRLIAYIRQANAKRLPSAVLKK